MRALLPGLIQRLLHLNQIVFQCIEANALVKVLAEVDLALSILELLAVAALLDATFNRTEGQVDQYEATYENQNCPDVEGEHSELLVICPELPLRGIIL